MAANTDNLRKKLSNYSSTLNGGISDSATTIALNSTTNLPTDTAVELTIDRVDSDGVSTPLLVERVTGVISGNDLTNALRGQDNTSAIAHSTGAVVEDIWEADTWNDLLTTLLIGHTQAGLHDFNGGEVIIDADADTSMTADTDDRIDWKLGGSDRFRMGTSDFDIVTATGNIQVNATDPWRTVSIFGGMKATTTSGCASKTTIEAGTNDIDYDVLDFDASSDENAFVNFQMPDSWDGGVVQFRYVWTNAGGGAAETVVFELSGRSFANDDAIDQAVGTAVEVSDTWIAQGDAHISAWSGDVTLSGGPAAGEWVHFEVMRDVSEDNLTGDARLMDVQIRYKQAQFTD